MKITDYGLSMYGGWYINYYDENGNWKGVHGRTLTEAAGKIEMTRYEVMKQGCRYDN